MFANLEKNTQYASTGSIYSRITDILRSVQTRMGWVYKSCHKSQHIFFLQNAGNRVSSDLDFHIFPGEHECVQNI
jgi:hypothetical protein